MVSPAWGLAAGPNSYDRAFETGIYLGQQNRERETRRALADYTKDPSEANFNSLADRAPEYAMQVNADRAKQEREQMFVQLRAAAIAGDERAKERLAALDNQFYNNFTKEQREASDALDKQLAQAAFDIMQRPPGERPQVWDAYARQLGAEEYVGQYSDQLLNTFAARAGIQKELQKFQRPGIEFIPNDATAYATNEAGENVLRALNGQPPIQSPSGPQGGPPPENPNPSAGVTTATEEQIAKVTASFGGDRTKVEEWMSRNNVVLSKSVNGQTYYKVGGQWFDNPEGR